ncbi:MAG: hypothetical protein WD341_18085 [Tistlia sp.]|uniref:hypothetical protein n=1 Tax=Tistlia sp. TaxID=3057121 RepID=UPI0034A203E9
MPSDPIFRAILVLLGLDVVVGAMLMLLAHGGWIDPALGDLGFGLGLLGGLLYLGFRRWGRRRAQPERARRREPGERRP